MKNSKKKSKEQSEEKRLSFFDILNNINDGQRSPDLFENSYANYEEASYYDEADKAYLPFMINRGLSYFNDTVLLANAMNERVHLPAKMQYDFYKNLIRPRKRFSKWFKAEDDTEEIKLLKEEYGYSTIKAREALSIIPKEVIQKLKIKRDKGGTK